MREIFFRGKRIDNGEWVQGFLCFKYFSDLPHKRLVIQYKTIPEPERWIPEYKVAEVDPSTVGQFTGLHDKNGKKIFEGDVFREEDDLVCVVVFKGGCFCLEWYGCPGIYTESGYDECGGEWGIVDCETVDMYNFNLIEVIGNIHDDPELLEG